MKVQKQIDELLVLRASEWFELLPTASKEQLRELESWLNQSRLHVQEFLEIAEVEFGLMRLDPERRHDVEALLDKLSPQLPALPARTAVGPFSFTERQPQSSRWWQLGGLAAAACVLVALGAVLLVDHWGNSNQYRTSVGEQRIVELTDASVITLNVDSQIEVRLEKTQREIDLRRGEAVFKVAHDSQRPFRVRTRAGVVQAVGTQFNVHDRSNGDTRVSVLEGKVRAVSSAGAELMLGAGEEADIRLDGTIAKREHAVVANTVAWRQHRLIFDNASIEEMAAEFNRYSQSVRVRPEGLEGDEHRFDAAFDATDPQSLAELLSREPDLVVERRDGGIVIRRR